MYRLRYGPCERVLILLGVDQGMSCNAEPMQRFDAEISHYKFFLRLYDRMDLAR